MPTNTYTDLFLAPLTDEIWNEFRGWYALRQVPPHLIPIRPRQGVWVVSPELKMLVAGICIYPTDGPFAIAEFFSVHPKAPGRLKSKAMRCVALGLTTYAQMSGQRVFTAPNFVAGVSVLKAAGFVEPHAVLLHSMPGMFATKAMVTKEGDGLEPAPRAPSKRPPAAEQPPHDEPLPPPRPRAKPSKKGKKR